MSNYKLLPSISYQITYINIGTYGLVDSAFGMSTNSTVNCICAFIQRDKVPVGTYWESSLQRQMALKAKSTAIFQSSRPPHYTL